MTNDFPEDRTVPAKLKKEIDKATGKDKVLLQQEVQRTLQRLGRCFNATQER